MNLEGITHLNNSRITASNSSNVSGSTRRRMSRFTIEGV
jgi:hypothetical protein